jgi:STE24 endopeptidase
VNEDKGTRYRRSERGLRVLEAVAAATGVLLVATTPVARGVARAGALAAAATHTPSGLPTQMLVAVIVLAVTVLVALTLSLPFAVRRTGALARRYGARVTPPMRVVRRAVRHGALLVTATTLAWTVFLTVEDAAPWLAGVATGVIALIGAAGAMLLAPWVVGLSSHVRPMRDEALTGRLHALAARAQIRLIGLQEWVFGETDEANAALIGVVGPRRLLVSDTLIAGSAPEEVDVVVAHELGHHAHGHTWRRARGQAVTVLVAAVAAQLCGEGPARMIGGAAGAADPASLPWMLAGAGLVWLVTRPGRLAVSRAHEEEADAFALALTGRPDVLERVLLRLGARNLASDDDSPWTRAFFLTHPPVAARVAAARRTSAPTIGRRSLAAAPDA